MSGYSFGAEGRLLDVVSGIGTPEVASFGNSGSNVQVRFFENALSNSAYLFGMSNSRGFFIRDPSAPNPSTFLGIGTTSPGNTLSVSGNASVGFLYSNIAAPTSCLIVSSNIGIGTTVPLSRLSVVGGATLGTYSNVAAPPNGLILNGSIGIGTTTPQYNVHVIGNVFATGDIIALSDSNVKTDLLRIPDALNKVQDITGYTFRRTDDISNKRTAGLIAQEVQKVLPEVVYEQPQRGGTLSLAYANLTGLLVEAIKELNQKVDHLYKSLDIQPPS